MSKKKLQVFISSTFTDLKEERQAAVEAVLGSRHIPAGMELFKAGNKSQLETIKRWINESDLYMLILGGRYGSIDANSGKSYTQIEYEYAVDKGIPVFSVVLKDSFLHKKASKTSDEIFETVNKEKYEKFKELVMSKIIKQVDDCKDIQIAVKDSISELENDYELCGWVRGSDIEDSTKILKQNNKLLMENEKLKKQLLEIENKDKIGKFQYEELKKVLGNKKFTIPGKYMDNKKDFETNYLQFIIQYKNSFITGLTNQFGTSNTESYIYFNVCPFLVSFGLLEINKVTGVVYRRIEMSKEGLEFVARLEIEINNKLAANK